MYKKYNIVSYYEISSMTYKRPKDIAKIIVIYNGFCYYYNINFYITFIILQNNIISVFI